MRISLSATHCTMKYLYASSIDSLQLHPDNSGSDFTIDLPQAIEANECALGGIFYQPHDEELFVLCDICEASTVRDTTLQILRLISKPGEMENLYFIPVTRKYIQRIRFRIVNGDLTEPTEALGTVTCVLLLK